MMAREANDVDVDRPGGGSEQKLSAVSDEVHNEDEANEIGVRSDEASEVGIRDDGDGDVGVSDDKTNMANDVEESGVGESDGDECRLGISEDEFGKLDSSVSSVGVGGQLISVSVNCDRSHSGQDVKYQGLGTVDWLLPDDNTPEINQLERAVGDGMQPGPASDEPVKWKQVRRPNRKVRIRNERSLKSAKSGMVAMIRWSEDRVSQVTSAGKCTLLSRSITIAIGHLVRNDHRDSCWLLVLEFHPGHADEWPKRWLLLWRGHRSCMFGSKGGGTSWYVVTWLMTSGAVRTPSLVGGYALAKGCGRKRGVRNWLRH
ncbi:hypothetical protein C0Q70_19020 [Pomacea canaliculata]|uniref:Uncharacterized protein n=1 Tax=Pomacea canaliculata TaxID=400727 RepID=A0A2T7NI54_POMCA|nr:hypothetical protein C0Q70_19020 [Pomacea canaliculata]